jgi:hypothetical protein
MRHVDQERGTNLPIILLETGRISLAPASFLDNAERDNLSSKLFSNLVTDLYQRLPSELRDRSDHGYNSTSPGGRRLGDLTVRNANMG